MYPPQSAVSSGFFCFCDQDPSSVNDASKCLHVTSNIRQNDIVKYFENPLELRSIHWVAAHDAMESPACDAEGGCKLVNTIKDYECKYRGKSMHISAS
jgi:hypothetical protein